MRFDLVDLQLFIAIAEARSITGGAGRAHLALASASARIEGLEAALGTAHQFSRDRRDGGGRHRYRGDAGSRRQTLREIDAVRPGADSRSWANRKLAIWARSFRALPRPAQQPAEHLRKAAQH